MAGFSEFNDFPFAFLAIPLAGMGIGALAIWTEHMRKQKSLDVLKAYAERGEEPPKAVLDGIFQATNPGNSPIDDGTSETGWRKFVFFMIMALGFGGLALWTHSWPDSNSSWPFTMGFGITAFVMAALSASKLVQALTGPKKNAG